MKKTIIAIGSLKNRPEQQLFNTFYQRLNPAPLIREILPKASSTIEEEALLILNFLKEGDYVIALDEKGKQLSTRDFAMHLDRLQREVRQCVFIIGGADGLDSKIKQRAQFCLSLSLMTWPHLMVRALLAEQLYRCQQISNNHPYHRN
jgi:23S rRNA (pseudouridine1915-N3)-methyltransferase